MEIKDTGKKPSIICSVFPMVFSDSGNAQNNWLEGGNGNTSDANPIPIPFDADLIAISFTNTRAGADPTVEIHKADSSSTNTNALVHSWDINNIRVGVEKVDPPVEFDLGDKIAVFLDDGGTNPANPIVTLYFKVRTDEIADFIENYSGNYS